MRGGGHEGGGGIGYNAVEINKSLRCGFYTVLNYVEVEVELEIPIVSVNGAECVYFSL